MAVIDGIRFTPEDLGKLLNGKKHTDECGGNFTYIYSIDREGKIKDIDISCSECGFELLLDGSDILEVGLEIIVKGREIKGKEKR